MLKKIKDIIPIYKNGYLIFRKKIPKEEEEKIEEFLKEIERDKKIIMKQKIRFYLIKNED